MSVALCPSCNAPLATTIAGTVFCPNCANGEERFDPYHAWKKWSRQRGTAYTQYHPQAELVFAPELRERNLGIYEGGPREQWKKVMKEFPIPFHAFKPGKGESYEELQERVRLFFQQLCSVNSHCVKLKRAA